MGLAEGDYAWLHSFSGLHENRLVVVLDMSRRNPTAYPVGVAFVDRFTGSGEIQTHWVLRHKLERISPIEVLALLGTGLETKRTSADAPKQ